MLRKCCKPLNNRHADSLNASGAAWTQEVIAWQLQYGRHDLPWQQPATPYRVWISEVMLQQTQVKTVIPYFARFLELFPDPQALALAAVDDVLALWSGLGYYRRAHHVHQAAQQIQTLHQGSLPLELKALCALPGIGRSTAGAILSLGAGQRAAILDGNVKRLLMRLGAIPGWPGDSAVQRQLWALAEAALPQRDFRAYNQGLMDLGALICAPRQPQCNRCPVASHCAAYRAGRSRDYPAPRPQRVTPEQTRCLLLVLDAGHRVLLTQADYPTGIWPGLWRLPEMTCASLEPLARFQFHGLQLEALEKLPERIHTLTHRRLRLCPWRVRLAGPASTIAEGSSSAWFAPEAWPDLGLPAPVRALLELWALPSTGASAPIHPTL